MKKVIAIAALLIGSISISVAQGSLDTDKPHFGAKIGLNYANVYDSRGEEFDADAKTGLALGAFFSIPLGELFGIQPEILFSQKGFKGSGRVFGSNYSFTRTTSYIDVPLYFAIKPSPFLTLVAGPQFSYLVSRKDVFNSSVGSFAQEDEFKNDNIRKNTLGASIGLDINVSNFVIGARANWDLQENNGEGATNSPRYKNQWLQATVGFRF